MRPTQPLSSCTRTAYATALTLLLVLGQLPTSASCFCRPQPPSQYLDGCGVVFAATYLGLYADTTLHDAYGAAPQVHQFRVGRYWLGLHGHTERLSLAFAPECSPRSLRTGTAYLVYLRGPREPKSVSSLDLPAISFCDSLVELTGARKNLAALDSAFGQAALPTPVPGTREASVVPTHGIPREGVARTSGTHPTETLPGFPWQATTWLLAALSAGLLVLLVRRKGAQPAP